MRGTRTVCYIMAISDNYSYILSMRQRAAPALHKAYRFLCDTIARRSETGDLLLPSIDTLTARSGVSRATLCKAVRIARDEGLISTVHGRGMVILKKPAQIEPSEHSMGPEGRASFRAAWERARERIESDITTRIFAPGEIIPSCKELAERCGTSYVNVKKALAALEREKKLVRYKRGYRVFAFEPRTHRPMVVFVGLTDKEEILSVLSTYA
ncbi:MAG: GntR family transcriptional regulator, partial [Chitinivibrionales bacterium]|nr:GntR family transcriptional regulator [Chitinivibrionales bacterium]